MLMERNADSKHIVDLLNTGLYYSNVGYVLAQLLSLLSLAFCKFQLLV